MVYSVDFTIKVQDSFCTIHTELICATSVSECMDMAEKVKEHIHQKRKQKVHYFIEAD
jgi:hypothetical protein